MVLPGFGVGRWSARSWSYVLIGAVATIGTQMASAVKRLERARLGGNRVKLAEPRVESRKEQDRTGRARNKTAPRSPNARDSRRKAVGRAVRAMFLVLVYLAVTIAPLVLACSGMEPGRGFLINFSVALGFVGLSLMGLQFVVA